MEKKEFEKKQGTMNVILILIGAGLLTFIIVMIWLYNKYMAIPDTLCTCVFAACTGEMGFMSLIQNSKNKYKDRQWAKEDKAEEKAQAIPPAPEDIPEGRG